MTPRLIVLFLAMAITSGCAVGPIKQTSLKSESTTPHGVGIALAGGGTKAASYAMGVLAAIADNDKGFDQIDAISTVSGGGYSAFYLYSKLLVGEMDPNERLRPVKDYFDDCIPDIYEGVLPNPYDNEGSPPLCNAENYNKYYFQQFVRCRQDVLENDCRQQLGRHDRSEYAAAVTNTAFLLGATGLMIAPSLVANTAFDWPINMSPTRYAYMQGIGTAYGLYPRSKAAISETSNIITSCNEETFLNCDSSSGSAQVKRKGLDFKSLRELPRTKIRNLPVWYINATASKNRSVFGWAQKGRRDFTKYTLQMSPSGFYDQSQSYARSGFYGLIPENRDQLDLLDGVTAAAAFFDSNETALNQPWRMATALGQHLIVLDWGKDIPNPNVNKSWRVLHNILPAPLYYIDSGLRKLTGAKDYQDSVYIRLLDGGNNDNLGAYTLIETKMKHIIISDHAYDGKDGLAKMEDVCRLHNEVALRSPSGESRKLIIPGLENLPRHCLSFIEESECGNDSCKTVPGVDGTKMPEGGYSILGWKQHVLLGCIKSKDSAPNTCDGANDIRVYVLKPALDLESFMKEYLESVSIGKYRVRQKACSDRNNPGICEVAAYIADWYNHADQNAVLQPFPQNGTVAVTFASTGKLYGAYRELARWQMHDALEMLNLSDTEFNEHLKKQADDQIKRIEN